MHFQPLNFSPLYNTAIYNMQGNTKLGKKKLGDGQEGDGRRITYDGSGISGTTRKLDFRVLYKTQPVPELG